VGKRLSLEEFEEGVKSFDEVFGRIVYL